MPSCLEPKPKSTPYIVKFRVNIKEGYDPIAVGNKMLNDLMSLGYPNMLWNIEKDERCQESTNTKENH